jgi:hypothetical protein
LNEADLPIDRRGALAQRPHPGVAWKEIQLR